VLFLDFRLTLHFVHHHFMGRSTRGGGTARHPISKKGGPKFSPGPPKLGPHLWGLLSS